MLGDLDDASLPGLEVDHGGRGGEGVAVDQELAAVWRPERGSEVAYVVPPRAVRVHHPHAATGPRLVARMEQEGDPLVVRRKGWVIAIAEVGVGRSPVADLDRPDSRAGPLGSCAGFKENSTAVVGPLGHSTVVE